MPTDPTPDPPVDAEIDAALREAYAFAPAAAEEAAARFRLPEPRAARWPWLLLPAAAAAGLAVGLLRERPPADGEPPLPGVPPRVVAGFVALATRPLEGAVPLRTGMAVHDGETVRVPADGRAALVLSDGSEVRLDRGARVTLTAGRAFTLEDGRAWSRVVRGDPFLVSAGDARVSVLGTEVSVARGPKRTEVQLFSGSARVEAGGAARDLVAGQEVDFADGRLSDARRIYSEAIATGWMLELSVYAGTHARELADHMDRMIAEMGRRKIDHLEEEAIVRDLGGVCRVPVARFLVSEAARADTEIAARRKAARVLESIADASVATELAAALRDADAQVRVSAAKAIRRASDGTACARPDAFKDSCDLEAAATADAWAKSRSAEPPPK